MCKCICCQNEGESENYKFDKKILIQFCRGRLPVKFLCFFVLKIVLLLLHVNQVSAFLVKIKTTWIKQLGTFPKIPFLVSLPLIGISYYSCLSIY